MRNIIALTALVLCAAGQAQTVDICDRTPQVRDAILQAVGGGDCAAVEADIVSLPLYDEELTTLRTGGFDGLTSLET